jgi:glycosidase
VKALLKRGTAALLAALIAWTPVSASAAEVRVDAGAAAPAAVAPAAAAGAAAVPLALTISPAFAGAPSLDPSPWNPSAPTTLLFPQAAAPAQRAPAVGAASMPPVEGAASRPPLEGAASRPPLDGAASRPPLNGAASRPPVDGAASKPPVAGAASKPALDALPKKARDLAQRTADSLGGAVEDGELPPPADAVDSLSQATLDVDPARAYHPSPEDWRDELLYPVVVDRFARAGKPKTWGDQLAGNSRHGGNLRGLIEKLDYIKESGATTIIVSPLTMTIPQAYHGYAPIHFLAVDPHYGTMADFKELVAKAHAKGLRVVLDWVVNHSGPVFEYSDGKTQWTGDGKAGPVTWTRRIKPVELGAADFTRERVITNWNDEAQVTKGDFPPNYRHLATDRPETQAKLIHIAEWWMKESDIDGFRLDAIRHVAPGFMPVFSKAIRGYAKELGKTNFLMLGEDSTGVDAELAPHLADGGVDTVYNYPEFRRANHALHGAAPTRAIEDSLKQSRAVLGDEAAKRLVRFIDLHDVYRFLLSDTPFELLKVGMAYTMLSLGIPLVYAGTEQGFRQLHGRLDPEQGDLPADPDNRADQFAGEFRPGVPAPGDAYDTSAPGLRFMRALADLRKAYPALRRGEQYERWSDPSGPGVYAFSRIHDGQEVLVVMNTSAETRSAEMWVDDGITPPGAVLEDALSPSYRPSAHAADGGSKVSVEVPPYGVRVLVRSR